MTRFALAAALFATATPAMAMPSYDIGYAASSTREYAILKNTGLSLQEAHQACENEGFYLAELDDIEEFEFVKNAVASVHGNFSWLADSTRVIGLHANHGEGYSIENGTLYVRPDNYSYGAVCERGLTHR